MRISVSVLCGLLFAVVSLPAQAQPVTTLSNAELFSRQYAQVDTARNDLNKSIVSLTNKTDGKKKTNCWAIPKTVFGGVVGQVAGAAAFGGVFIVAAIGSGSSSEGTVFTGMVLSGIGSAVGCAHGVHKVGKKYCHSSEMLALSGIIVAPLAAALVASLISDNKQKPANAAMITFAFAPITSTAAYYIFSKDLPDTTK